MHLAAALRICVYFRSGDHAQLLVDGCVDIQRQKTHYAGEENSAAAEVIFPMEGRRQ